MFERFSRKTVGATGATLLAALGIGSVAVAQSGSPTSAQAQSSAQTKEVPGVESDAPENSAKDRDNVQYTAPGDADAKQGATKAASTSETPGSEKPGDDGPGGHADEPGNPNADHQFQGKE